MVRLILVILTLFGTAYANDEISKIAPYYDVWREIVDELPDRKYYYKSLNYDTLMEINDFCNNSADYKSDMKVWKESDYWATPDQLFAKGYGDCEDFAMCKYYAMKLADFDPDLFRFKVGSIKQMPNVGHIVLSVTLDRKEYILDNYIKGVVSKDRYLKLTSFNVVHEFNENYWKLVGKNVRVSGE